MKQALVIYLLLIGLKNNAPGWEMGWNYRSHVPSIRSELLELRVEGGIPFTLFTDIAIWDF